MLYTILYLEKLDQSIFTDLKKRVENNCALNKAEYPMIVTAVHSLLLNYQPNYNYSRQYQSNRVSNQLIFTQRGKTGDDEVKMKAKHLKTQINLDHSRYR